MARKPFTRLAPMPRDAPVMTVTFCREDMIVSAGAVRRVPVRDDEFDDGLVKGPVVGVRQDDLDLVRSGAQTVDDDGLAARIKPIPWCIVHDDVEVADARRYSEGVRTKHRHDPQILDAVLDQD